jgi:4-nitrophenyl phosphatase
VTEDRQKDPKELVGLARRVLRQEAGALESLQAQLDPQALHHALHMILGCRGMVMAVGAGTSSTIARRLAHLLTYAGVRAMYLDSGQAQHGYSGLVTEQDRVIGITEKPDSTLGRLCDIRLEAVVAPEHDATGVLPLATSLAHAAIGDILCAAVQPKRGFSREEMAELHPGGAVGKHLNKATRAVAPGSGQDPSGLGSLKGLILDMDGVLWHGELPLPGLAGFFDVLERRGIQFILATNNPSKKPEGFAEKARRMGVKVDTEQVVTSAMATVHYLKGRYPAGSRIHVIGESALREMVAGAGFELADDDVVAVVVALDRSMTYETIERGTLLIRGGADFIGTNPDPFYPTERGILPGSGTMVATLKASTARTPIIAGKPERWLYDLAMQRMGLQAEQVASVGDRLDTDIAGGQRLGMRTILVLSGIVTREILAANPVRPTWVFPGIAELGRALEEAG